MELWALFGMMMLFFSWMWSGGWNRRDRAASRAAIQRLGQLEAELAQRDATIAQLAERVAELENRLDFAERLLASGAGDGPPGTRPRE